MHRIYTIYIYGLMVSELLEVVIVATIRWNAINGGFGTDDFPLRSMRPGRLKNWGRWRVSIGVFPQETRL